MLSTDMWLSMVAATSGIGWIIWETHINCCTTPKGVSKLHTQSRCAISDIVLEWLSAKALTLSTLSVLYFNAFGTLLLPKAMKSWKSTKLYMACWIYSQCRSMPINWSTLGSIPDVWSLLIGIGDWSGMSWKLYGRRTRQLWCTYCGGISRWPSYLPRSTKVMFLSPPVHFARWAHMRHFLSVCLSVRLSVWTGPKIRLDNNSYLRKYYI